MEKKKQKSVRVKILKDFNELLGMVKVDGVWYISMEYYNELQSELKSKGGLVVESNQILPKRKSRMKRDDS